MKKISLNKGTLELPESWDDLTFGQKKYGFGLLKRLIEGEISPGDFRIKMLIYLTGYRPSLGFSYYWFYLGYLCKMPFTALWYYCRLGRSRFLIFYATWKARKKPKRPDREIINFNLFRLSEQIDFAFRIRDQQIILNRKFKRNPVPYIKIDGKVYQGKRFNLDIAAFTDLTAREFSDCYDLYITFYRTDKEEYKVECLNKIVSILYPICTNYDSNLTSNHSEHVAKLPPEIRFGIFYWFTGIVDFYINHPVYSVLFRAKEKDAGPEKISLGMNEVVLSLIREQYTPDGYMNLNDFFDAQVKYLKDTLSEAIAKGAKVEELSQKTRLSINDINRLV